MFAKFLAAIHLSKRMHAKVTEKSVNFTENVCNFKKSEVFMWP